MALALGAAACPVHFAGSRSDDGSVRDATDPILRDFEKVPGGNEANATSFPGTPDGFSYT